MNYVGYSNYHIRGLLGGLPKWFVTEYEPYLKLEEEFRLKEQRELDNIQEEWKKYNLRPSASYAMDISRRVHNKYLDEKQVYICELYYKTISNWEQNAEWPKKYLKFKKESLHWCFVAFRLSHKKHKMSDKLISSIIENLHDDPYVCDELIRHNLIKNGEHAKSVAPIIFRNLKSGQCINLLIDWNNKGWINPADYLSDIKIFIGSRYRLHSDNADKLRRALLSALKNRTAIYKKLEVIFNQTIREYNIANFNDHIRYDDNCPKDFIATPFADGTRMRVVRSFFKWKLV